MTAAALQQLAWHLPPEKKDARALHYAKERNGQAVSLIDHGEDRFLDCYKNLQFGWRAVQTLAANHIPFPGVLEGDDEVIYRAYLFNCARRYYDQDISEAVSLTRLDMKALRNIIEALLVTPEMTIAHVSEATHIRYGVILAYEKLFFNILDRKKDESFIATTLYPDGRLVEMFEEYLHNEDLGQLLKRAGFNNGADDILYLAGFGGGLLHNLANDASSQRLEGLIMANGLLLARNGWLNQQANNAGLFNARTILTAAKQSGIDEGQQSPFSSFGATLKSEILTIKGSQAEAQIKQRIGLVRGTVEKTH